MQSNEIRERFLRFFEKRGHTIIPSASLVPENDPSVLFNTAGMQPLVPYLLGETHPTGATRLVDSQKCVRTVDIDEIGDNTHATFFEMLGNWSLGDPAKPDGIGAGYFKEDTIKWSFEFLTSKEEGLGLDAKRLYVTVFEGDENAPRDEEAFEIWKNYIPESRIYFMGAKSNWWSPGDNGPCGPDTEMFYDVTKDGLGDMTPEEYMKADDEQKVVEIWNDVFMEYEKKDGKVVGKLKQKNVDTGSGLERVTMVVQGKDNIFETDLLEPIIKKTEELYGFENTKIKRIVADHVRTSVFMISDGVVPSNTDRGYILRRLLRRSIFQAYKFAHGFSNLSPLVDVVAEIYSNAYPEIKNNQKKIHEIFDLEEMKFMKTLSSGEKELRKLISKGPLTDDEAFMLFTTYGFPFELSKEISSTHEINVHTNVQLSEGVFAQKMKEHQEISRQGSEQKFKGGLADHSEMSVKYHTATHLLHQALRTVLGEGAVQKGSNITPERLRFDFVHDTKMTDEEKKRVEDLVNEKIREALPVSYEDISMDEAKKRGAIGLFEEKYGDTVRVYQIGGGDKKFSLELCGGPHVKNTSELGHFVIKKEEACSAGIRRIKAILEA
jgi:alanyl-tRNA synthetase